MAKKTPVGIVVRRGALRRFDALTRKTAAPTERRSGDRRKKPPFTWEVADFVVVDAPREDSEPRKK